MTCVPRLPLRLPPCDAVGTGGRMGGLAYDIDLEDLQFILFDQLDVDVELKAIPKYADFDQAVYEATLEEARRIAVEVLAPINRSGDREGCRLEPDGSVVTPSGYR